LESADSAQASAALLLVPPIWGPSGPTAEDTMLLTFSGPSGQSYQLLTTTNIILPWSNWSLLHTGVFGASPENYTHTNVTDLRQFYRIKSP
jgi:hypothetical protein